jgi:gamma-glutamyltranspeptidase/glutathione hydrolase
MKDGKPFMSWAVQGGDTQDQNLLQCFLNVVEFGMTIQQACEAANINSNQLWLSLGGAKTSERSPHPGEIIVGSTTNDDVKNELTKMGYKVRTGNRTSGPSMQFILTGSMEVFGEAVLIMEKIMDWVVNPTPCSPKGGT